MAGPEVWHRALGRTFRVARPAGAAANLGKTGFQLAVVWELVLGLLPALLIVGEDAVGVPRWQRPVADGAGIVVFALGSALGLTSAWTMAVLGRGTPVPFDCARDLVVAGPYRWVRNPMAVSAIVQVLGVALVHGSAATALMGLGGGVVWNVGIRPSEERFLARRFGPPYDAYRAAVRCWVPRWSPYRTAETPAGGRRRAVSVDGVDDARFADIDAAPDPAGDGYVAVIFTSQAGADHEGYAATAAAMRALATEQPGYLGIESATDPGGFGITVSYWATEADGRAWKQVAEHARAQRQGRDRWYDRYVVRVARVGRHYGWRSD